ncbi:Holliday junction branch migration protein RuvA [Candidatus Wolfebacteria bacterium]|nr:Holliday junction branch migration protein RuvA [Candidatus Wolfebacteria bacterium]
MIYCLSGKLIAKNPNFAVIEASGIGFKVFISPRTDKNLSKSGKVRFFCSLIPHREGLDLYGFLSEKELEIFELFRSIAGIGPKAALKILGIDDINGLLAAINEGRGDLLTKAAGVGAKKAERVILEMRGKIKTKHDEKNLKLMESDLETESALKNLGYKRDKIASVLKQISPDLVKKEDRIKAALKILAKNA